MIKCTCRSGKAYFGSPHSRGQCRARHRAARGVSTGDRQHTGGKQPGSSPKPQSLSPKVRFSFTNYSWHRAKCIQMKCIPKKTSQQTTFSLAPEMIDNTGQSTHFLTKGISLEGRFWNRNVGSEFSLSSYHKRQRERLGLSGKREGKSHQERGIRQGKQISSAFLADMWLVPRFPGPAA